MTSLARLCDARAATPVMPAKAGIHDFLCCNEGKSWVPAGAGMTRDSTEESIIRAPGIHSLGEIRAFDNHLQWKITTEARRHGEEYQVDHLAFLLCASVSLW